MAQYTFTKNIKISNFKLTDKTPQYSNQTWTGQRIVRSTNVQWYEFEFQLQYNKRDRLEVQSFVAQYKQGKPFQLSMGHLSEYIGKQTGAVSVKNTVQRGVYKIQTTNPQVIEVGSYIQFANHKKLYSVLANTGSEISVYPPLQAIVQAGEGITYNGLVIEGTINPDNDYSVMVGNAMSMNFRCMEVVR
ncbi:hypothetical protein VC636_25620 [Citrobacter freundii]|uniref:hypothetical protein n=1 Tax=Citrobacter freundii TaxID=546 RepID=UPI00292B0827|nr:hypothetical protein [Citrobacter freundii]MDV0678310.1 hypothetical protein [Citrobacter freundii]MDV0860704.1 hypothetical protein [Citrobacter freundii]MEB0577843.1 hypothetical protein [Citrobacter freundii]MEB0714191.1 hypothetical protein [Citrobacter freundii]